MKLNLIIQKIPDTYDFIRKAGLWKDYPRTAQSCKKSAPSGADSSLHRMPFEPKC